MQKAFWSDYIPFVEDITQLAADTFPKEDEKEEEASGFVKIHLPFFENWEKTEYFSR